MVSSVLRTAALISVLLCAAAVSFSQEADSNAYIPPEDTTESVSQPALQGIDAGDTLKLSLVFAGDIMGHDGQINGAWDPDSNRYDYEPTFRYISDYISNADIAIANFEVTLGGPPYKGYPEFSSPDALAVAARDAGFDIMIQANNHALDRGQKGFARTIKALDSLNIVHTGTFLNDSARQSAYPLIVEKNGIRVAILNYTYGTNGLTIPEPYIINRIDTTLIRKDIYKARLDTPDFVIVTIHWGTEYERTQNPTQEKLAAFILGAGADAVIGSHPHVVQPVEKVYNADSTAFNLVVYSLGNFVSNQRDQYRDGGITFGMTLEKYDGKTVVSDYSYLPYWVYRDDKPGRSIFYVMPVRFWENNPGVLNLTEGDIAKIKRFAEDTRSHVQGIPESSFYDVKEQ